MGYEFFSWGNLITWAVCSVLIYLSLNFRLYMIFHHPSRKMREKVRARRRERALGVQRPDYSPRPLPTPRERDCLQGAPCFVRNDSISDERLRER